MTALHTLDAGPTDAARRLLLAHGAGAPMDSPFLESFVAMLAERGIASTRFEFPYMAARRVSAKRKPPPKAEALVQDYASTVQTVRRRMSPEQRLFIGGKSMGGRVATQVAAADRQLAIDGLVLLGYPLHPPGKPDQLRDKHLPLVGRSMLFVQGSRDGFGTPAELEPVLDKLTPRPLLHVIPGGDHSFKVPGRNSDVQNEVYAGVQRQIVVWMRSIVRER